MSLINEHVRGIWALGDEPWGDTMTIWFAIAEVLWTMGEEIPEHWVFRASPAHVKGAGLDELIGRDDWPDIEVARLVKDGYLTAEELRYAGNVFTRYAQLLKVLGRDY